MVVANGGGAASRRGTLGAAGDRGERAWLKFDWRYVVVFAAAFWGMLLLLFV